MLSGATAGLVSRAGIRTGCLYTQMATKIMSDSCAFDRRVIDSSAAGNRGGIEQLIRDRIQP